MIHVSMFINVITMGQVYLLPACCSTWFRCETRQLSSQE